MSTTLAFLDSPACRRLGTDLKRDPARRLNPFLDRMSRYGHDCSTLNTAGRELQGLTRPLPADRPRKRWRPPGTGARSHAALVPAAVAVSVAVDVAGAFAAGRADPDHPLGRNRRSSGPSSSSIALSPPPRRSAVVAAANAVVDARLAGAVKLPRGSAPSTFDIGDVDPSSSFVSRHHTDFSPHSSGSGHRVGDWLSRDALTVDALAPGGRLASILDPFEISRV